MAHHLLANNPGQQDAGEILLSGLTHMAFQMEAQRRQLMKPAGTSKPRRGKRGPKKQPQRGLGVAQLEKIRLEEQRRASQQAHQLAALRQLHASPPFLNSLNSAALQSPACIIPQLDRESTHAHHPPQPINSALPHLPSCVDALSSSFLLSNVSLGLRSAVHLPAAAAPLELFPTQKPPLTSLIKDSDGAFSDKNWTLHQPQRSLNLPYDQSNETDDHGGLGYSLLHRRQNCFPIADPKNCSTVNQMSSMASPLCNLERIMELSSFQNTAVLSRREQLVFPKRQAWDATAEQPGSLLNEPPLWAFTQTKPSIEQELHHRIIEEDCELRLRPPGWRGNNGSLKQERAQDSVSGSHARRPQNFLSLSMGSAWDDSVGDASSSTPSPASATTKTTPTTASASNMQEEYTSRLVPSISRVPYFSTRKMGLFGEFTKSHTVESGLDLDLNLKL